MIKSAKEHLQVILKMDFAIDSKAEDGIVETWKKDGSYLNERLKNATNEWAKAEKQASGDDANFKSLKTEFNATKQDVENLQQKVIAKILSKGTVRTNKLLNIFEKT